MQRLEIKNFGPIEKLDLEIKDYLIFIGPQAVGKSTVSKAIYFFKSLRNDLVEYILESVERGERFGPLFEPNSNHIEIYKKLIRKKFRDIWGFTSHLQNIRLCYHYKDAFWIEITSDKDGKYISPAFSNEFRSQLEDIFEKTYGFIKIQQKKTHRLLSSTKDLYEEAEKRSFLSKVHKLTNELFYEDKELLFIPAGRSLLATLTDKIGYIKPDATLDYLMFAFIAKIIPIKSIFNKGLDELVEERTKLTDEAIQSAQVNYAKKSIEKILKGEYRFDNGEERIYFDKDRYTKIAYASSGQQESIYILLIIFFIILTNRNIFIVIEEPESNLYPEAQKEIVDLIFLLGNMNDNQVIITTHSPYILEALNNLIYANKIGKKHKEKTAEKINPLLWVNFDKLGSYFIDNGNFTDILDKEIQLIKTEAIDSASEIINDDYDYLFSLDE